MKFITAGTFNSLIYIAASLQSSVKEVSIAHGVLEGVEKGPAKTNDLRCIAKSLEVHIVSPPTSPTRVGNLCELEIGRDGRK